MDDPDLSALIRDKATHHGAPEALRAAVRTQIAIAAAAGRGAPPRRWWALRWPDAALGFALGLACAVGLPLAWRLAVAPDADAELVADHVQALRAGPLFQVASSDRHTVKPWFQGRIDYAPPVFDFAGAGFPLLGGRVDKLDGNPVAVLVYARNRHLIDLVIEPASDRRPPQASVYRGFNVVAWSDGAMRYRAVSDLEAAELAQFAALWHAP